MAKLKLTVYPYAIIDEEGRVQDRLGVESYRSPEATLAGGSVSSFSGVIYVHLPTIELLVEVPNDIKLKALPILQAYRKDLRAEHQKQLTKLQFLENNLLALSAPDVLDAGEGPQGLRAADASDVSWKDA